MNLFYYLTALGLFLFCGAAFLSPLGAVRIGGPAAIPLLRRYHWFAVTLCTSVATGILFWVPAEPLFHYHEPPALSQLTASSIAAQSFAMSTLFMHWTLTPYGIYTAATVVFALSHYNLGHRNSLSALVAPALTRQVGERVGPLVDIVCVFALVAGMTASLGTGALSVASGLGKIFSMDVTFLLQITVVLVIVAVFTWSAITGLFKGITFLSNVNIVMFVLFALVVALFAPLKQILELSRIGISEYLSTFFERSVGASGFSDQWQSDWTVFYWANWMAWTPITALFLGRISYGYKVREVIIFNLALPVCFSIVWITLFGATSLSLDLASQGEIYQAVKQHGVEAAIYSLLEHIPGGAALQFIFVICLFLSFVTAADSNTVTIAALSTRRHALVGAEPSVWLKLFWASVIGLSTLAMLYLGGIDGVRKVSVIGGYPASALLFITLLSGSWMVWQSIYVYLGGKKNAPTLTPMKDATKPG